jgi:hypothetical protein
MYSLYKYKVKDIEHQKDKIDYFITKSHKINIFSLTQKNSQ